MDNRVLGAKRMQESGIMRYAGDLREHMPEKVKAIVQEHWNCLRILKSERRYHKG